MQHLNYCRQLALMAKKAGTTELAALCDRAQKFILPFGGSLLEDPHMRALDESLPLRLPHPVIALEFQGEPIGDDKGASKRVILCEERSEHILVFALAFAPAYGSWTAKPRMMIPKVGYVDRSNQQETFFLSAACNGEQHDPAFDYEVGLMLGFLNVLACKNVTIERSEPKNAGKKIKPALPFDTYHILTMGYQPRCGAGLPGVCGHHRSPREHVRRGHIRRLAEGRRIWVNAALVAAGAVGVVKKDYLLQRSQ